MALNTNTDWEIRTTGLQTNGGGFANLNPGISVDYSQQNSPQLSLSDISTNVAGTQLTSVTGGFTQDMEGNCIYLTGGGATAGWYQIPNGGYINTNNVTIDRSAGASKTGVTGNVGGAFKIGGTLDSDFFASSQKVAGNVIYIKSGTYTLGESISIAVAGTTTTPICMIGYQSSRGDNPIGNNRPIINCGSSYSIASSGNYWQLHNLIFTGSASNVINHQAGGGGFVYYNCKITNTSGTSGRNAVLISAGTNIFISCEFSSTNGNGVNITAIVNRFINCYLHDSNKAINDSVGNNQFISCIIANCTTGSSPAGFVISSNICIFGCVIYNCTTGIVGGTTTTVTCVNNIIANCTTGASWTTEQKLNFWDFNCWNNTTDVVNVTKGPNDVSADPKLKDPANGDFTLDTGSPCFDAGIQLGNIVGL